MNYTSDKAPPGKGTPGRETRKEQRIKNIAFRPCPRRHNYQPGDMCGPYRLIEKRGDIRLCRSMFWDAECPVCGHKKIIPVNNMHNFERRAQCSNCIELAKAKPTEAPKDQRFANNGTGDIRAAREIAEMRKRIAKTEEDQWRAAARRSA